MNPEIGGAISLEGGTSPGIVRIGETVRRPLTDRSPFVHALLRHLEAAGVSWTPRFLGIDEQGREILTFVDGEVCHEAEEWGDDQLSSLVSLIRQMHDATAGSPLAGSSEVICHNDLAPWNTVVRNGLPVAFIDFNDAAPGSRVDDLGYFSWVFLGLGKECTVSEAGRRIALLCDAYGLKDRTGLLRAIEKQQRRILAFRERQAGDASQSEETRVWALQRAEEIREDIRWVIDNRNALTDSLCTS